jgi:hypothetical protein
MNMILVIMVVIMVMNMVIRVTMVTGHRRSFRNCSWFQLVSHQTPYATGFATDAESPPGGRLIGTGLSPRRRILDRLGRFSLVSFARSFYRRDPLQGRSQRKPLVPILAAVLCELTHQP